MITCDSLFIGFDLSPNGDVAALSVLRMNGIQAEVLNIFTGEEARDMYEQLTGIKIEEGSSIIIEVPKSPQQPLTWDHIRSEVIGRASVTDTDDGIIVNVAAYHPDAEFFNKMMNKTMDEEIRK